jgi:hypothetical protein
MKLTKGMKKALSLLLSAAMVVTGVNVTTGTASAADTTDALTKAQKAYDAAVASQAAAQLAYAAVAATAAALKADYDDAAAANATAQAVVKTRKEDLTDTMNDLIAEGVKAEDEYFVAINNLRNKKTFKANLILAGNVGKDVDDNDVAAFTDWAAAGSTTITKDSTEYSIKVKGTTEASKVATKASIYYVGVQTENFAAKNLWNNSTVLVKSISVKTDATEKTVEYASEANGDINNYTDTDQVLYKAEQNPIDWSTSIPYSQEIEVSFTTSDLADAIEDAVFNLTKTYVFNDPAKNPACPTTYANYDDFKSLRNLYDDAVDAADKTQKAEDQAYKAYKPYADKEATAKDELDKANEKLRNAEADLDAASKANAEAQKTAAPATTPAVTVAPVVATTPAVTVAPVVATTPAVTVAPVATTPAVVAETEAPVETEEPEVTAEPIADGTAFIMYAPTDWSWGSWSATDGLSSTEVVDKDGTYTLKLDVPEGSTGDGGVVFNVDIANLAQSKTIDASNLEISDIQMKADGKDVAVDSTHVYYGDIEGNGNVRLELRNEYGYGSGGDVETSFLTKDEPGFDQDNLTFTESLEVTFTVSGLKEGETSKDAFYDADDNAIIRTAVNAPAATVAPVATAVAATNTAVVATSTAVAATQAAVLGTKKLTVAKKLVVVAPGKSVKVKYTAKADKATSGAAVVTATSKSKKVATVSVKAAKKQVVIKAPKKAVKGANTTITVKSTKADGKAVSASITVYVRNTAKKVKAAKKSITVKKGKTVKLVLNASGKIQNKKKPVAETVTVQGKVVKLTAVKYAKKKITLTLKGNKKAKNKAVTIKVGSKKVKVKATVK